MTFRIIMVSARVISLSLRFRLITPTLTLIILDITKTSSNVVYSIYHGLPDYKLHKCQRVLNSSARLVLCAPRFCHITLLLWKLHCLPVHFCMKFKSLLITSKVLKVVTILEGTRMVHCLVLLNLNPREP